MDAYFRPFLNHEGIVTKSFKGEWKVLCNDEIDFSKFGEETAEKVCSILGFSGTKFFNTTLVTEKSIQISNKRNFDPRKLNSSIVDSQDLNQFNEEISTSQQCTALFVICKPQTIEQHSNQVDFKKNPIPLNPVIQPNEIPKVFSHFNKTLPQHNFDKIEENWPWNVDFYLNGKLICNGVLVDRYWVLVESGCMGLAKYFFFSFDIIFFF